MQPMDGEHALTVQLPARPRAQKPPRRRPAPAGIEPPRIDHLDLRSAPVTWSVTPGIDSPPMTPEQQELNRNLHRWANAALDAHGGDPLRYVVRIIGLQRAARAVVRVGAGLRPGPPAEHDVSSNDA